MFGHISRYSARVELCQVHDLIVNRQMLARQHVLAQA